MNATGLAVTAILASSALLAWCFRARLRAVWRANATRQVVSRALCIACSLVPALAVWGSDRRYREFAALLENRLSGGICLLLAAKLYFATFAYWPHIVLLGWLAMIPAMFGRPWCAGLRRLLIWSYLVIGLTFHLVCLEALYPYSMHILRGQARTIERLHQPPP